MMKKETGSRKDYGRGGFVLKEKIASSYETFISMSAFAHDFRWPSDPRIPRKTSEKPL